MKEIDMRAYGLICRDENINIGRIVSQQRSGYKVITGLGEKDGSVSGSLRFNLYDKSEFPAVGDWVKYEAADKDNVVIHEILPRKTVIFRKVCGGKSDEQVLAANVDKIFIVMSLNGNFNLRRLERYINIAWDSGAMPVIVLTKADLADNLEEDIKRTESVAIGIDVFAVSAVNNEGVNDLREVIGENDTVVFVGSSGAGKSTLINALMGEEMQKTSDVGINDKGRHTTTSRELFILPGGGIVIDTPGMREIQVSSGDVEATFVDIDKLAEQCRFPDCKHDKEPGCAVRAAIERGEIEEERLNSYWNLKVEIQIHELRHEMKMKRNERKFNKKTNRRKMV